MILQEQHLYILTLGVFIAFHSGSAIQCQNKAGLAGIHPNSIGEQLFHFLFAVYSTGQAVDDGGVHMQNVALREQIVQQCLHRGTADFTPCTGIHHIGQDRIFPFCFIGRILIGPHFTQQGSLQNDKVLCLDGCEGCAGAFYPQSVGTLIRGVAAACQNKTGICTVFIGHLCQCIELICVHFTAS